MLEVQEALWLIPAAPLLACILIAALGHRVLRDGSHWPCVIALIISFVFSALVLISGPPYQTAGTPFASGYEDPAQQLAAGYEWIRVGSLTVNITLRVDALTAVMLVTVTFVSLLVAIYSIGYMRGDPGYPRYFAEIALFVFSMTMLVLADNFLLLYVFWEGVGLCSYLLIGYWYQRPSAAAAARKAFLVNRIGDLGFALGIFLIWTTFAGNLDYGPVFSGAHAVATREPGTITAICLLLFVGAVGKSAQFPLHVWLPDAMEGPSPVSALIHAATMVTAGVYLIARCTPLFSEAPQAQLVVAGIGGLTALLAALIALTQNDLKRVLAYSTVSQLGLMFLALGSAAADRALATFAVTAAIFHLFTHAFFKALLFLGAGSVMHAMGDVIDMRRFGGLRRVLKHTHWTFLIGAAALAGFPLLSGFWSKDEVLSSVYKAWQAGEHQSYFMFLYGAGLLTTFLTAVYTSRAYFMTFWGQERFPPEAGEHPHESPPVILTPLIILAICALVVGALFGPATHWFASYLGRAPLIAFWRSQPDEPETHGLQWSVMLTSAGLALAGIALAWWLSGRRVARPVSPLLAKRSLWYSLSANRFYLDEIYHILVVLPLQGFAYFCRGIDYMVDQVVDLVGRVPEGLGRLFRPVQNGLVQFYALAMILGLTVFVIALLRTLGE